MAKLYINPVVVTSTMELLREYKAKHPESVTPMFDACKGQPDEGKAHYVRAAKRLGWNVVRSQGHVYENGRLVW